VSGLPARGDAPDPAALPGLKQPAPVRVIERVKPAPADYAGLEVRIEGVVERDSLTLVTLFCPQMGRTDQLSFSWGSRRASKVAPTMAEIESFIGGEYLPSLVAPWQAHQARGEIIGKVSRGNAPL